MRDSKISAKQDSKILAKKELSWAISHRRHLHKFPELSFEEEQTSLYCQKVMKSLGLEVRVLSKHGFIADLKIANAKKTIAWRTELDALAITEKSDKDFASQNIGVAHMCGHDMHMALALLGAKILSENPSLPKNNVRFIFQPAEEILPGGAKEMIANGCLDGVDEIYALHNDILNDTGVVCIKEGAVTAAVGLIQVVIRGKGTHVATPELGRSPITAACRLIAKWYEMVGKLANLSPRLVFQLTRFTSGSTFNVIPEEAIIYGSIRSYDEEDFVKIEKVLRSSLAPFQKEGFKIDFTFQLGYSPTINSVSGVARVVSSVRSTLGEKKLKRDFLPTLCGEDFSYYLQKKPGAFLFLGVRNKSKKIFEPQHSPRFDVDEKAIALGGAIMVELVRQ